MQVGTENKTKLYVMLALMAIAVFFLLRMLSSTSSTPGVAASVPGAVPAQPESANQRGSNRGKAGPPLDPTLRADLLKNSEGALYKGSGRNIFEPQATPPPIVRPTHPVVVENKPPEPAQPA